MAVSWVAFQTQANDQFWFQLDFWARATQKRAQLFLNSRLEIIKSISWTAVKKGSETYNDICSDVTRYVD